jgi:hypothetical protein
MSHLMKRPDYNWINRARFHASALRFKAFPACVAQQRRCHLAAGTIMNTDEQNLLFWHSSSFRFCHAERVSAVHNNSFANWKASPDRV